MKKYFLIGLTSGLLAMGCSVTTGTPAPGGSQTGGETGASNGTTSGSTGANTNGDGGGSSADDGGSGNASVVTVSTTAASLTFGSCPAQSACGGDVQGTWDYSSGCIDDPFAAVKQACPTATTENVTGTVVGTINIVGSGLYRDGKASFSGTVIIPSACTMGLSCAAVQSTIASDFDTVACTGSGDCSCAVTAHTTLSSATTFTQSGNTVTTEDGDSYDVCVQGGQMIETRSDANEDAEPGTFTLTKR